MRLSLSPILILLVASGLCASVIVLAVRLVNDPPSLQLTLKPAGQGSDAVVIRSSIGVAASLDGGHLQSVGGLVVRASDLIDEPDFLSNYRETEAFFARQTALRRALDAPSVRLIAVDTAGRTKLVDVAPVRRSISQLPPVFWAQIIFGAVSFLIAAWIWVLRPRDTATRLFALTGLAMLMSASTAAVYSSRELAIDGQLFRWLSAINHAGPMIFGWAMIGLFLHYPRKLIQTRTLLLVLPLWFIWFAADVAHVLPNAALGTMTPLLLQTAILALVVSLQWRATRCDSVGRAAMRWFGSTVVLTTVLAAATMLLPRLFGTEPLVEQGYAFGFFFLIYVGLAVGLRRSRIFQLDGWAFRIGFLAGAAILLIALDASLILLLRGNPTVSLGLAMLIVTVLYLPLREWIWRHFIGPRDRSEEALFSSVVAIAVAVRPAERSERWRGMLQRLFEPLEITPCQDRLDPAVLDDGLALAMPAVGASPALLLRMPWAGRGLFGPAQLRLAQRAISLARDTEVRREDYERGGADERQRIAQDLHDDVGSLLLSGLHKSSIDDTRQVIRDAIFDIRMLASELGGGRRAVGDLLADLRYETIERLKAARLDVQWPPITKETAALIDFTVYKAVRSSVRELITNVIRHSDAQSVAITADVNSVCLCIEIADNGRGFSATLEGGGMGLPGVARRVEAIGGVLHLANASRGTRATLRIPMARSSEP